MDRHDQWAQSTRQPLLLNFVRAQPTADLNYRYDETQRLNVTVVDGVPVVATVGGRALLKTQCIVEED
jgi:hypothetical protein